MPASRYRARVRRLHKSEIIFFLKKEQMSFHTHSQRLDDGGPKPHSYLQVYIDDAIIVTASQETHVGTYERGSTL